MNNIFNNKNRQQFLKISLLASLISSFSYAQQTLASCSYNIDSQWNGGFNATVKVTNNSGSAVNGWNVSWQYAGNNRATSAWNAVMTGSNPYNVVPSSWNQTIAAGQVIEFGVQGTKLADAAEIPLINGNLCDNTPPTVAPILYGPVKAANADGTPGFAPHTTDHLGQGSVARFGQFSLVGGIEGDIYQKGDDLGLVQLYKENGVNAVGSYRLSLNQLAQTQIKNYLNLGRSVALNENWLVMSALNFVGVPAPTATNFPTGAVFLAKKNSTGYNSALEEKFIAPPLMPNNSYPNNFGLTVSIGQDILLVGSSDYVHLYKYNPTTDTWENVFNIPLNFDPNVSLSTDVGKFAALSPDAKTVVIAFAGRAKFYERATNTATTWTQVSEYVPQPTVKGVQEYMTVDLDNAAAIIGYGKNISIIQRVQPQTWGIRFDATEVLNGISATSAVAIAGNRAVASKNELVSVMELVNGIWSIKQQFSYPTLDLGWRLDLDGDNLVVGGRGYDGCAEGSTEKLVNTGSLIGLSILDINNLGALNLGCNRLINSAFTYNLYGWNPLATFNGAAATQASNNGELQLNISNGGSQNWHVQATQNLGVINIGSYSINLKAHASVARNVTVTLGQAAGTNPAILCTGQLALTTTAKSYSLKCPNVPYEANARLDLNVGAGGNNTVYFDDIALVKDELVAPSSTLGFLINSANNAATCVGTEGINLDGPLVAVPCVKTTLNQFVFNGDLITRPNGYRVATNVNGGLIAELILNRGTFDPATGNPIEAQAPAAWSREDKGAGTFALHPGTDATQCAELTAGSSVRIAPCIAGAKNQQWLIK